ncbi:hypothetical protein E1B28_012148 [Marasmius oreades]|uniref:Uncharacterized protein n=1 Tax=Marasmius oreades TaxID=181124 RepID=A0A9P7RS76_9AGAR|nr:uncharacterized protein E1B28_012148 [Marasmius oreades]KAG7088123.1 hypothetical protein E1B28_012148 [Marasmius oreades]
MRLRWIMFAINVAFSYSMGRGVLYTTLFLTIAEYLCNDIASRTCVMYSAMVDLSLERHSLLHTFELDGIAVHAAAHLYSPPSTRKTSPTAKDTVKREGRLCQTCSLKELEFTSPQSLLPGQ